MIKTIFFDFFGTLAKFHPDREEIQMQALSQFGLNLNSNKAESLLDANIAKSLVSYLLTLMDSDERTKFFSEYESLILDHAGFKVDLVTAGNIWRAVQQIPYGFKLYDDVIPVFKDLNTQNYKLGIITNMGKSLYEICDQLEISKYLSYIITSEEVGIGKPSPEIFKAALKVSESKVNEVIHVGDSYDSDIAGSIALDIKAILIDRDESQQKSTYQFVINELKTLYDHL